MARFLSADWLAELDAAAREARGDQLPPPDVSLVIEHVVDGGPDGEVAYALRFERGAVRIEPGRAPDADVTLLQDHATAASIARAQVSAQAAFMAGRVHVRGDLRAMMEHQDLVARIDPAFEPVRAATTY